MKRYEVVHKEVFYSGYVESGLFYETLSEAIKEYGNIVFNKNNPCSRLREVKVVDNKTKLIVSYYSKNKGEEGEEK